MNVNKDLLGIAEREAVKKEIDSLRAQLAAAEADLARVQATLARRSETLYAWKARAEKAEAERDRAVAALQLIVEDYEKTKDGSYGDRAAAYAETARAAIASAAGEAASG